MAQLLIIDVQKTFKCSKDVVDPILKVLDNYSEVIYLYDVISGDGESFDDMWEEFYEDEEVYSKFSRKLTKEYAFFRDLMDAGVDDEFIVELVRLMMKHKICDARDIAESEHAAEFEKLFARNQFYLSFDNYGFHIPEDLVESLRSYVRAGVTLVGGGLNECLKEVELLLCALDIKYSVLSSCTY